MPEYYTQRKSDLRKKLRMPELIPLADMAAFAADRGFVGLREGGESTLAAARAWFATHGDREAARLAEHAFEYVVEKTARERRKTPNHPFNLFIRVTFKRDE